MMIEVDSKGQLGPATIRLRCPFCKHLGAFEVATYGDYDTMVANSAIASARRCPSCRALVFIVYKGTNPAEVIASYPPEVIDFDTTGLPTPVVESLGEALVCHSQGCHRAAAIMVRRTLEEVCHDKGATGKDLKDRLAALGSLVLLPQALIAGLSDLRLLGNDAAHIKSTTYQQVGKDEIEVAIDVTKTVLQAVYQYADLVQRLDALKAQQAGQQ